MDTNIQKPSEEPTQQIVVSDLRSGWRKLIGKPLVLVVLAVIFLAAAGTMTYIVLIRKNTNTAKPSTQQSEKPAVAGAVATAQSNDEKVLNTKIAEATTPQSYVNPEGISYGSFDAAIAKADSYAAANDFNAAIASYKAAEKIDPNKITYAIAFNIAIAYENADQKAEAKKFYEKSITLVAASDASAEKKSLITDTANQKIQGLGL